MTPFACYNQHAPKVGWTFGRNKTIPPSLEGNIPWQSIPLALPEKKEQKTTSKNRKNKKKHKNLVRLDLFFGSGGYSFSAWDLHTFSLAAQWEESSCLSPLATNLPLASRGFHLCFSFEFTVDASFLGGLRLAVFWWLGKCQSNLPQMVI